jgi:DNA helicase-2/ATP-dependent DNA helicase PcrA
MESGRTNSLPDFKEPWMKPHAKSSLPEPGPISPILRNNLTRKLTRIQEGTPASNAFEGDDPQKILPGMKVEHQRFGLGKVLQIEGIYPDLKATIFFHNAGQKQLLLRFAKLKIIN